MYALNSVLLQGIGLDLPNPRKHNDFISNLTDRFGSEGEKTCSTFKKYGNSSIVGEATREADWSSHALSQVSFEITNKKQQDSSLTSRHNSGIKK